MDQHEADVETDAPLQPSAPRRRWVVVAAVVGAVVVVAGGAALALVVLDDDPPSPAEELQRLQAFVEDQRTARFTGQTVFRAGPGDDRAGTTYTETVRLEGDVAYPDRARWVADAGHIVVEQIGTEGISYVRDAEDRDALEDRQWAFVEHDDEAALGAGLATAMGAADTGASAFTAFATPHDLLRLFTDLDDVVRPGPDLLRSEVDLDDVEFVERLPEELRPSGEVTVEIRQSRAGELERLVFNAEERAQGETVTSTVELRFTRWGDAVEIEAPTEDDLDPTPGVQEEDIDAFGEFDLFMPAALPEGFVLAGGYVTPDPEDPQCGEVTLEFSRPGAYKEVTWDAEFAEDFPPFLDISMNSVECGYEPSGDDISVGGRPAMIERDEELAWPGRAAVYVDIGETQVIATSNLDEEQLLAAVARLVPLDLSALTIEQVEPPRR